MLYNATNQEESKYDPEASRQLFSKEWERFYLSSTYASFSVVWTYYEGKMVICNIQKGKVIRIRVFQEEEWLSNLELDLNNIENELFQKNALELDGDCLSLKIQIDGKPLSEIWYVDIECFKASDYESVLLSKIRNDIIKYKMWDYEYE